jgi:hypothetical protein
MRHISKTLRVKVYNGYNHKPGEERQMPLIFQYCMLYTRGKKS